MKYLNCEPQVFTVPCPMCEKPARIPAEFGPRLTVGSNGGRLALKMSAKSVEHDCDGNDNDAVLPLFPDGGE